jgi:hypothetical protein
LKKIDADQGKEIRKATLKRLASLKLGVHDAEITEVLEAMQNESVSVRRAKQFCEEVLTVIERMGYKIDKGIDSPNFRGLKTSSRKFLTRLDRISAAKSKKEKVDEAAFRNFIGVVEEKDFTVEVYSHRSGATWMTPVIYTSNKNVCIPARTREESEDSEE